MGCYKFKVSEVDVALSRVDGYNEMEEVIIEVRRASSESPVSLRMSGGIGKER